MIYKLPVIIFFFIYLYAHYTVLNLQIKGFPFFSNLYMHYFFFFILWLFYIKIKQYRVRYILDNVVDGQTDGDI